jgi:putative FmdB family regulatory protein
MPIYEFECSHCGHRFDRLQKLSDTDPSICPACDAPQLRRRVSAPSFRLAGSGWYETDFKKEGDKKRNLAEGSGGDAKPSAGESTMATPPAAPPAASPAPAAPSGKASGTD